MIALACSIVRATTRESDLAVIAAFSLVGIVLTLALVHFGLDVGTGIAG